jgi:hypothetical protein
MSFCLGGGCWIVVSFRPARDLTSVQCTFGEGLPVDDLSDNPIKLGRNRCNFPVLLLQILDQAIDSVAIVPVDHNFHDVSPAVFKLSNQPLNDFVLLMRWLKFLL